MTDEFQMGTERLWRLCCHCALNVYRGNPPTLPYASRVAQFLLEIAAQESSLRWERQRSPRWDGSVGGFSKWQMERGWILVARDRLLFDEALAKRVEDFVFCDPNTPIHYLSRLPLDYILVALRMNDNDALGAALCRVGLLGWSEPIPPTLEARAALWKKSYNTVKGKGTVEEYIHNAKRLCSSIIEQYPLEGFAL